MKKERKKKKVTMNNVQVWDKLIGVQNNILSFEVSLDKKKYSTIVKYTKKFNSTSPLHSDLMGVGWCQDVTQCARISLKWQAPASVRPCCILLAFINTSLALNFVISGDYVAVENANGRFVLITLLKCTLMNYEIWNEIVKSSNKFTHKCKKFITNFWEDNYSTINNKLHLSKFRWNNVWDEQLKWRTDNWAMSVK